MLLPFVFDAKMIHYEREGYGAGGVLPQARDVWQFKPPPFARRDFRSLFARILAAGKPYIPFCMHMYVNPFLPLRRGRKGLETPAGCLSYSFSCIQI